MFERITSAAIAIAAFASITHASTQSISSTSPETISYQNFRPQWGLELQGAALNDRELTQIQNGKKYSMYSLGLQWEFQPRFIQTIGVLGAGLSLGAHPGQIAEGKVKSDLIFAWSAGGQVRYQARFFENQWIVPMVAYSAEIMNYQLRATPVGRLMTRGPTLGAWILLNALDTKSGRTLFYDYGVARTYLVAEMKTMTGQDTVVKTNGRTYYVGLRFEY